MAGTEMSPWILLALLINSIHFSSSISFWPKAIVPYTMSQNFSTNQNEMIFESMQMIENFSCIKFLPYTGKNTSSPHVHIRLAKIGDGCWSSYTGFSNRRQTLSLEPDQCFDRATILHELMHVLGFFHEHNRPDRDDHILIKWENVLPNKMEAFTKRNTSDNYLIDRLTDYDLNSIMHYSEMAFSSSGEIGEETIISKYGYRLGGASNLSPSDIYRLNKIYDCKNFE